MSLITPSTEMFDRVVGLRVVRSFTPDPIPADEVAAILEAARWTGSSKNRQGWEFIVIDGDQLDVVATAGSFTDPIRNSTTTIALVETTEGNPFDIGRVAQNIMLAAAARGIGSCPITLHDTDRATEVLELPSGLSCRYAIALGYPLDEGEIQQRAARRAAGMFGRKPMADLTHRQRYGS